MKSEVGSLYFIMSKYVSYYLQKFIPFVPSFVKNPEHVRMAVRKIQVYNMNNVSTTNLDTIAMSPNIDTSEGVHCVTNYTIEFKH